MNHSNTTSAAALGDNLTTDRISADLHPITPFHFPWITLLLSSAGILIAKFRVGDALQFNPSHPIANPHRIFLCHLAHWSWSHLGWSLGSFILLGAICELRDRTAFLRCVFLGALVIPLVIALVHPAMGSFRGMSGIDSALFLLLAIDLAITQQRAHPTTAFAAAALILLFIVKLIYEHACHSAVFADSAASGFVPVPASHLAGATVGVFVALLYPSCRNVSRRACFLRVRHPGDAFQT